MPTDANIDALMTLCGAIAASNFEISNRVKSIAQVAHEYLETSSIIVYAHNRATEQLDVIAMPGVTQRELMRGPTDKIIFQWDSSTSDAGRNGIWLENNDEFDTYIRQLATKCNRPLKGVTQGNFRKRELDKYLSEHKQQGRLATAKIYMWKGLGQTGNKVGQLFFNFFVTEKRPVFTPPLKKVIRFISDIIRELLIDRIYHEDMPTVQWTPEYLLRELNSALEPQSMNEIVGAKAEYQIANIIREAALKATENFGGYADLIILIGRKFGRIFDGNPDLKMTRTIIIQPGTITDTCIEERKYFVGNGVRFYDCDTPDENKKGAWPHEIESAVCKSLMVVPVVHEDEVKAVIRLTSPRDGCFLDPQARAMRTLENLARYGLLCLDQYRQRERMSSALDFYTSQMSIPSSADPSFLMKGVLSALGAEWGTFWPIDIINKDGTAYISNGIKFEANSPKAVDVEPSDPQVGIRGPWNSHEAGFSQTLIRLNAPNPGHIFFSLYVCLPAKMRYGLGLQSNYYLQVFSRTQPPNNVPNFKRLPDDFYCYSITDQEHLPEADKIHLSQNTDDEIHTRVAFVVSDQIRPIALVWLKFPGLHEIEWWERRYILGLSSSLGKLLQVSSLEFAIHSFRHMIPGLSAEAEEAVECLKSDSVAGTEKKEAIEDLEVYTLTMMLKSAEVKALLSNTEGTVIRDRGLSEFGERSIGEYVDKAIAAAVDFRNDRTPWKIGYGVGVNNKTTISGVFYSVLLNLLKNVVLHGWDNEPPNNITLENRHAFIWIRKKGNNYYICVGNTGKPSEKNPFELASSPSREDHGAGLHVAKAILRVYGGDIRYVLDNEDYFSSNSDVPIDMRKCNTLFEFFMPTQN